MGSAVEVSQGYMSILPRPVSDFQKRLASSILPASKKTGKAAGEQLSEEVGDKGGRDAGRRFGSSLYASVKAGPFHLIGAHIGASIAGAIAAVGVGRAIGNVISTGFGENTDYQTGLANLQSGLRSTNNEAHVTAAGLEDLAGQIQLYSGQTDDSIVASEQLLLTFTNIRNEAGKNNDIFTQTVKITADVAQRMGGDASNAAIQLGKALNDPVTGLTALTRIGVSFTQQQKDQIKAMVAAGNTLGAQKLILAELNKEFGGSAKTFGTTLPGDIAIAKRSYEDFSQALIASTTPLIQKILPRISGGLEDLAGRVTGLPAAVGPKLAQVESLFDTHLRPIVSRVTGLGGQAVQGFLTGWQNPDMTNFDTGLSGITEHIGSFFNAFDGLSVGRNLVKNVAGGIQTGLDTGNWKPLGQSLGNAIIQSLDAAGDLGKRLTDWITQELGIVDWGHVGHDLGGWLATAVGGAGDFAVKITAAIGRQVGKIDWVGLGLQLGKQAPGLIVGFLLGVLNVNIGDLVVNLAKHWWDVLVGVLLLAATPARIADAIGDVLLKVPFAGRLLKWVSDAAFKASKGLVKRVLPFISGIVDGIAEGLGREAPHAYETVVGFFQNFLGAGIGRIRLFIGDLVSAAGGIPGKLSGIIGRGIAVMLKGGADLIRGLSDGFMTNIRSIDNMTGNIGSRLLFWARGALGYLRSAGADLLRGLFNGASAYWHFVTDITGGIGLRLLGWARDALSYLAGAGRDLLQGLFNGATDKLKDVGKWIGNIGSKIIQAVKDFFHISSPSQVFHELGGFMMQGLFNGILAGGKGVAGLVRTVFHDAIHDPVGWAISHVGDLTGLLKQVPGLAVAIAKRAPGALAGKGLDFLGGIAGKVGNFVTGGNAPAAVQIGQQMAAQLGWSGSQWQALYQLWQRESGWNPTAVNPQSGAAGIPQALGHGHVFNVSNKLTDIVAQIQWGLQYILGRYGSPLAAWAHELSAGWYAKGGLASGWSVVGEQGPELAYFNRSTPILSNTNSLKLLNALSTMPSAVMSGLSGGATRSVDPVRSVPLLSVENMHVDSVDLDLLLRQQAFRQQAGSFGG